jgi:hypothetical protein
MGRRLQKPAFGHSELALVLEPSIYRALDSSASFSLRERSKFLDMCKSAHAPSLLNGTTTTAFSHQFVLSLSWRYTLGRSNRSCGTGLQQRFRSLPGPVVLHTRAGATARPGGLDWTAVPALNYQRRRLAAPAPVEPSAVVARAQVAAAGRW